MKKFILFILLVLVIQACSAATTPTLTPTPIPTRTPVPPTPVGYGVEFPFNPDAIQELGENVSVTCETIHEMQWLDPDTVRELVAAGGKLDTSAGGDANLTYLWTGNVPLELFAEPEDDGSGFGTYYDYWATSYCVAGLDERGWSSYITVITKIMPQ